MCTLWKHEFRDDLGLPVEFLQLFLLVQYLCNCSLLAATAEMDEEPLGLK